MKILGRCRTHCCQPRNTELKGEGMARLGAKKKPNALTRARSLLKKADHAHTPETIRRKLKPKKKEKKL